LSQEGSNGDTGLTGDLLGAWMRTVSMRTVIVPPRFEGLPTASSQTVPMNGCFPPILSLRWKGTTVTGRTGRRRRMGIRSCNCLDVPPASVSEADDVGVLPRRGDVVAACLVSESRRGEGTGPLSAGGDPAAVGQHAARALTAQDATRVRPLNRPDKLGQRRAGGDEAVGRIRASTCVFLVGARGFEPLASSASRKRSTPELSAREPACYRVSRRGPELNRCTGFCRPLPNHSATPPGTRIAGRARVYLQLRHRDRAARTRRALSRGGPSSRPCDPRRPRRAGAS
jgi:hypothetical protein